MKVVGKYVLTGKDGIFLHPTPLLHAPNKTHHIHTQDLKYPHGSMRNASAVALEYKVSPKTIRDIWNRSVCHLHGCASSVKSSSLTCLTSLAMRFLSWPWAGEMLHLNQRLHTARSTKIFFFALRAGILGPRSPGLSGRRRSWRATRQTTPAACRS